MSLIQEKSPPRLWTRVLLLPCIAFLVIPLYIAALLPGAPSQLAQLRLVCGPGLLLALLLSYRSAKWKIKSRPPYRRSDATVIEPHFSPSDCGVRVPEAFSRLLLELSRAAGADELLECARRVAVAAEKRDASTSGHSERVTQYAVLIAKEMKLSEEELRQLRIAAQLHDIGKIAIADRILGKPGALTAEEFEIVKRHPIVGADLVRSIRAIRDALPGIEYHHETLDGSGYPYGLEGTQVPLQARIITVADTFDAMTTDRPYQSAISAVAALRLIDSLRGTKFDPKVVGALTHILQCPEIAPASSAGGAFGSPPGFYSPVPCAGSALAAVTGSTAA